MPPDPVTPPEPRPLTAEEERAIRDRDEMWRLQRDGSWTYLERGAFTQPMHEHTEQAISDRRQLLVTLDEARALPSTPTDRDLHTQEADSNGVWCREDGQRWPCDAVSTPTDRDFVAQAEHIRAEHDATHGEAEMCGAECIVLGLAEFDGPTDRERAHAEGWPQSCPTCARAFALPSTPIDREAALRDLATGFLTAVDNALMDEFVATEDGDVVPEWSERLSIAADEFRAALAATPAEPAGLHVERLAEALRFAHHGPRPWPGKLTSAEFARVIAAEYDRLGESR